MELNRCQFELLSYIEEHGKKHYSWRELADALAISGTVVIKEQTFLLENHLLAQAEDNALEITESGLASLEPYRVERAVIFAAGFGSRMVPATLDTPKPLVMVNGVRIIDRLLDALVSKGIYDITIVRGYLKDKFDELLVKYPFLTFIDNDRYETENNISSALLAKEKIRNCYICAGDLLLSNPAIIKKYHYQSNYLASYALETDDWCFDFVNGYASHYRKGGTNCFNQYEITYWNEADCRKLVKDWEAAYALEKGYDLFWEFIPLVLYKEHYQVEIRQCRKTDIMEIDNFYELAEIDPHYRNMQTEK